MLEDLDPVLVSFLGIKLYHFCFLDDNMLFLWSIIQISIFSFVLIQFMLDYPPCLSLVMSCCPRSCNLDIVYILPLYRSKSYFFHGLRDSVTVWRVCRMTCPVLLLYLGTFHAQQAEMLLMRMLITWVWQSSSWLKCITN